MSAVRFGAACDRPGCTVVFNDYTTGDIRTCEDCGLDLCALCAAATRHVEGRDVCCCDCAGPSWVEVEAMPIADAIADAETLLLNGQLGPIHTTLALPGFAAMFGYETAAEHARVAAHVAFRAVPELRA